MNNNNDDDRPNANNNNDMCWRKCACMIKNITIDRIIYSSR